MIHQAKSDPQLLDEQLASAISAIGTFATCRRHSEYVCLAVKTGSDHDKSSGEGILTMRLATEWRATARCSRSNLAFAARLGRF